MLFHGDIQSPELPSLSQVRWRGLMCIHYEDSFCVVRADSWVDQKEKKCPSITTLVLFASKESKQDYVSLIVFRIIPFTYASHLMEQHVLHSHIHPLQWSGLVGGKLSLWGGEETGVLRGDAESAGSSVTVTEQGHAALGIVKTRFKWNTYCSATEQDH